MLHKQKTLRIPGDTWELIEVHKIASGTKSDNAAILDLIRAGINASLEPVPEPIQDEPFDVAKQYGLNMKNGHNPNPVPEKTSGDAPDNVSSKLSTAEMEKRMGIE